MIAGTEILTSRRDVARVRPSAACKAAFGPFCANVRRLRCLTPTQTEVAVVLAKATLKRGFSFIVLGSLSELTMVRPNSVPFAGLGKNDISPALAALAGFGMVVVEECVSDAPGAFPATRLTVLADSSGWSIRASDWRSTLEEERALEIHWEACFQRFTAQFPELVEEADLLDARASVAAESASAAERDARSIQPQQQPSADRAGALGGDARVAELGRGRGAPSGGRSDFRNGEIAEKWRCVPTSGTPSRARLLNRKQKTETVKQLNSARRVDDSNRLLALLAEQFVRVHGEDWTQKEMVNSGAAWRMVARAWPDEFEIQVGELRNFINGGGKVKCAWAYFQMYFTRATNCADWADVCNKSRNLLIHQH